MDEMQQVVRMLSKAGIPFVENEPMNRHTTFKIGGSAAVYCMPSDEEQLCTALVAVRECDVPSLLLGKGSNLLFCDEGYRGVVIFAGAALKGISIENRTISAGAGEALEAVCVAAQAAGLGGLEFAYGIPGTVGGAVYMNAGAYGGEISEVLASVRVLNETCEVKTVPVTDLALGYRMSVFQKKPWYVLSANFEATPGLASEIGERMNANMQKRLEKQPLDLPSAGSAFKRPKGAFAGALIDQCGLRGYRIGGAAISEKHCGFIVNMGGATCVDVLRLAEHVQNTVVKQTGFFLEREICVVGAGK